MLIITDFIIGAVLHQFYFKVKSNTLFKTNYAIRECKEDVLLFGASETAHHLISNKIKDSLGLSCYNLGVDGLNIIYQYAVLQEVLKRYTPKIVVISATTVSEDKSTVKSLLPYCRDYPDIKNIVFENDLSQKNKLLLKSYPFNSLLLKIFQGMMTPESKTNGYLPLTGSNPGMLKGEKPFKLDTSQTVINYFTEAIKKAKHAGCRVYIFQAPRYQVNHVEDQFFIKEISEKYQVPFLNYLSDTAIVNHREYFKDGSHLNNTGAQLLTNKFIKDIKADLKTNPIISN